MIPTENDEFSKQIPYLAREVNVISMNDAQTQSPTTRNTHTYEQNQMKW